MLIRKEGNIFDSKAEVLVNPVNAVGVMGAGLALQFKKEYPTMFTKYADACRKGELKAGEVFVTEENDITIFNAVTKSHWKDKSKYVDIIKCLRNIGEMMWYFSKESIAIPMLGCGLGGLEESIVDQLIEGQFYNMYEVSVEIYSFKK